MAEHHILRIKGRLRRPDRGIQGAAVTRAGLGFMSVAITACLSMPLHAGSTSFNGIAALSSQLVDRGQAITGDTPIVQAAAFWTFPDEEAALQPLPSGWSLGLSGGTELRSPSRVVEALVQASRYWSLSDNWQMQVNLLYYRYPGNAGSTTFDQVETGVNWSYRDVLVFGLSAIYVVGAKGPQPRGAADVNFHWPLARHFSLSAGAGITQSLMTPYTSYRHVYAGSYDHHAYASRSGSVRAGHYGYGHVGLLWRNGPWQIELDRIVAAPQAQQQWSNPGASPWVATISRSF